MWFRGEENDEKEIATAAPFYLKITTLKLAE
jgi:hypothetical protein